MTIDVPRSVLRRQTAGGGCGIQHRATGHGHRGPWGCPAAAPHRTVRIGQDHDPRLVMPFLRIFAFSKISQICFVSSRKNINEILKWLLCSFSASARKVMSLKTLVFSKTQLVPVNGVKNTVWNSLFFCQITTKFACWTHELVGEKCMNMLVTVLDRASHVKRPGFAQHSMMLLVQVMSQSPCKLMGRHGCNPLVSSKLNTRTESRCWPGTEWVQAFVFIELLFEFEHERVFFQPQK